MKKVNFEVSLPVTIFREGDAFVAHTPVLDLSTCGDTLEEAQRNFADAVKLFIEECVDMGTLDEVLTDCGWTKHAHQWVPPTVVAHDLHTVQIPFSA